MEMKIGDTVYFEQHNKKYIALSHYYSTKIEESKYYILVDPTLAPFCFYIVDNTKYEIEYLRKMIVIIHSEAKLQMHIVGPGFLVPCRVILYEYVNLDYEK